MPRMNTCEELLLPASGALSANCRFGTTWSRTLVLNTCRSASASPENAEMAMGVSCRFSCTLRAVTMISSSVPESELALCACALAANAFSSTSNANARRMTLSPGRTAKNILRHPLTHFIGDAHAIHDCVPVDRHVPPARCRVRTRRNAAGGGHHGAFRGTAGAGARPYERRRLVRRHHER